MARRYTITVQGKLPVVGLMLKGKGQERLARVIFDTGAAITQINTVVLDELGYSIRDAHSRATAHGPAGPLQEGYALRVDELEVLGKSFVKPEIAVYDFDNLEGSGIDGLLGFDLIQQFHLEMNGPKGNLLVFDE